MIFERVRSIFILQRERLLENVWEVLEGDQGQNQGNRVNGLLKSRPNYKGAEGWCKFVANAHTHKLIDSICSDGRMVPAIEAILDGVVSSVKTTGGKAKGPSFILNVEQAETWLATEGATQPDPVGAPAQLVEVGAPA